MKAVNTITRTKMRTILQETTSNKELRARLEDFAEFESVDKTQREFVERITNLDRCLSRAAGIKPSEIDPTISRYSPYARNSKGYKIGGYLVHIEASAEHQQVMEVEVRRGPYKPRLAFFRAYEIAPEKVAELVVNCIDTLKSK